MRSRFRLPALIAAAGLIPLGLSGTAVAARSPVHVAKAKLPALTVAQVRKLAAHATDRSIIIFKNQLTNLPARGATEALRVDAAAAAQAPVLAELHRLHAKHVIGFHIINAIAATISPAEAQRLRANPAIRAVVPDAPVRLTPITTTSLRTGPIAPARVLRGHGAHASGDDPAQPICPSNPSQPLIEPQALGMINAPAADQIVNGAGIKVGVIADGIDPNNPDLIRPDGQHVVFDYQDFSGQAPNGPTGGQAGMIGVGIIASQGNQTYDLSQYVNPAHPLPTGCDIKVEGVAPGVSVAEANAFGNDQTGYNSEVIQALQYEATVDHVSVIDMPFGGTGVPNFYNDPPALLAQALVAAGIVVVAPVGDTGTTTDGNPYSPGGVPGVIGVGATTAFQSYAQTDQNGPELGSGGWEDNNISSLSASGINEFDPRTFDLVAPGDSLFTLCATNTAEYFGCVDPFNGSSPGIEDVASTDDSASLVAGVAALVQEAYAKTHGGVLPPAPLVEQIIDSTATDLGAPADHQGAGMLNALKAVQLAESINTTSPVGNTLLLNQTQLDATVNAGQSHTFSIGVTNEGTASQTVTPTVSGNPTVASSDTGTVTLSSSSPTYVDGFGGTDSYATHTFTVPSGAGYLNSDISWDAQAGGAAFEELFDPQGNLAGYSSDDANQSGFSQVEVTDPMAGTWTEVIYTINFFQYFGTVNYGNTTEDFHTAGSVSPASQTLAPGQSGTFQVTVTAGQPGDEAFSMHMGTGSSTDGAVPIVLRALVPVTSSGGSFSGTLTGDGTPAFSTAGSGQEFTYQFNVPAGEPSLSVGIKLADPGYIIEGTLVPPFDQGIDLQSGVNDGVGPGGDLQFFHYAPVAGLWTVSLVTVGPNDGSALSTPFNGTISFAPAAVTSSGIPDSATTVLQPGQPVTATVTVTNTGNIAKDYFADPRLNSTEAVELLGTPLPDGVPDATTFTVQEPLTPATFSPHWMVPTDTTGLIAVEQSTLPITSDMNSDNNDPEELGIPIGDDSVLTATSPELAPGQEWTAPEPTCPCSAAQSGTTSLTAVAVTNAFDTSITSSTGDAWLQQSINPNAPYTPLTLAPGQTGTITLTITPNAPAGTVVSGFIAVDTFNQGTDSGDELIHIPYTYTVG